MGSRVVRLRRLVPVLLALALVACGRPAADVSAVNPTAGPSAGPSAGATEPVFAAPPTLPPAQVRMPDRFDAQGCIKTSPATADCTQTAAELDATAAGATAQDWRTLAGFVGRYYTSDLRRDATFVLDESVTASAAADGTWTAVGLVRNEHPVVLGRLEVEATLLAADGHVLGTTNTASPVETIRPGEPVPFAVAAPGVAFPAVARVTWRVQESPHGADGQAPDTSSRQSELRTYWSRPYGDAKPIDFYLHHDRVGAPNSYLLFGSMLVDGRDLASPHVTIAWLDANGRVLVVRDTEVRETDGRPAATVRAGTARDFLVEIDDPTTGAAAGVGGPMLWGSGR